MPMTVLARKKGRKKGGRANHQLDDEVFDYMLRETRKQTQIEKAVTSQQPGVREVREFTPMEICRALRIRGKSVTLVKNSLKRNQERGRLKSDRRGRYKVADDTDSASPVGWEIEAKIFIERVHQHLKSRGPLIVFQPELASFRDVFAFDPVTNEYRPERLSNWIIGMHGFDNGLLFAFERPDLLEDALKRLTVVLDRFKAGRLGKTIMSVKLLSHEITQTAKKRWKEERGKSLDERTLDDIRFYLEVYVPTELKNGPLEDVLYREIHQSAVDAWIKDCDELGMIEELEKVIGTPRLKKWIERKLMRINEYEKKNWDMLTDLTFDRIKTTVFPKKKPYGSDFYEAIIKGPFEHHYENIEKSNPLSDVVRWLSDRSRSFTKAEQGKTLNRLFKLGVKRETAIDARRRVREYLEQPELLIWARSKER